MHIHTHIQYTHYIHVVATYLAYKLVAHINYAIKMPPRRLAHNERLQKVLKKCWKKRTYAKINQTICQLNPRYIWPVVSSES